MRSSVRVPRVFVALLTAMSVVTTPASADQIRPADLRWLVDRVTSVMPPTWKVVAADSMRAPIGWQGETVGLCVEIEDTRTRFFHPRGFHYYSFYRVWLMPPSWAGEMRETPYVADSVPAYLLGASDDWLAFYHTAGGNVWHDGLASLCAALELDRISYPSLSNRIVDLGVEERLVGAAGDSAVASPLNPLRILGLLGAGPSLYLEYVVPEPQGEAPAVELSDLTAQLAAAVFSSLPEIESLYLRRCASDSFTDTILQRD